MAMMLLIRSPSLGSRYDSEAQHSVALEGD